MHEELDPDFLLQLLSRAKCDYADFRVSAAETSLVRLKDGEAEPSCSESFGASCRVLMSGSWGFASSNRRSRREAGGLLEKAARLARLSRGRDRLSEDAFSQKQVRVSAKARIPVGSLDISEKTSRCLGLEKRMKIGRISNTNVLLTDSSAERLFVNSEGASIEQETSLVFLSLSAIAKSADTMQTGHETLGARAGYELLKDADEKADEAAQKAVRLLSAKHARKGKHTIIIDGKMAGVFAHEALGHASEADAAIAHASILRGRLGSRIGSSPVTIMDDATAEGFGQYSYDDEGIRGQRKVLVENGVLKRYLHSRSTAGGMGTLSTGNCRASSYCDFPIVRMSNTFFAKGRHSREDVFDAKEGIYLKGMKGGSVEPLTGTFVFTAEEGYEIKNGELCAPLRDAMVSGSILETLHHIEAVGKDFSGSPGFCGKMGQSVPVSDGGPHIRISEMLVG